MIRKDLEKNSDFPPELLSGCEFATLAAVNADDAPLQAGLSVAL